VRPRQAPARCARHAQRRRLRRGHAVGDRDQGVGRHRGLLDVATVVDVADDVTTDPARVHAFADAGHPAGDPDARHVRWGDGEPLGHPAADLRIEKQDGHDGNVDHGLSGSRHRVRRVAHHEDFWAAEPRRLDHPHQTMLLSGRPARDTARP
jgi:hypothetical protein